MTKRFPNLFWIGLLVAILYWVLESTMHTFFFSDSSFFSCLLGGRDPNELQMRVLTSALFLGFGWLSERIIRTERRMKEDAQQLHSLLRVMDQVKLNSQTETKAPSTVPLATESGHGGLPKTSDSVKPEREGTGKKADSLALNAVEVEIGSLSRMLQDLSSVLDLRFKELYALLELTNEINRGILLEEVLERAYGTLPTVIPFHRLGMALFENEGKTLRARWAKSDSPLVLLTKGYSAPLAGSSLEAIINTGDPRIINDLSAYFRAHPNSESTRLIVGEGIQSSLTCPLISLGKPIGFMFFSSRRVNEYQTVHVEMFRLVAGHLAVVVEKSNLYQQVLQEKEKSERLLLNVIPARVASRLRAGEGTIAESFDDTCVLFADIVSFTTFAGNYPSERVVGVLEELFTQLDRLCDVHRVEKIKTIGDGYMVVCTSSDSSSDEHLRNIAMFAVAMLSAAKEVRYPDGHVLELRVGINVGPVVAGVIGQKKFAYDIWGNTVNVASRMESTGEPGRIQVTGEIHDRLQNAFNFTCRGEVGIKGKGPMVTYFLLGPKSQSG